MKDTQAFTRLELVVIVGAFAALTAVLLPTAAHAHKVARDTECRDNLRDHGVALADFVAANHEYPLEYKDSAAYPNHASTWVESLFGKGSRQALRAGVDPASLLTCPSAVRPERLPKGQVFADYGYNTQGIIGAANQVGLGLGRFEKEGEVVRPVRDAEVVMPSEMVAFGDGIVGWGDRVEDGRTGVGLDARQYANPEAWRRSLARHAGSTTLVFADGHAAMVPIREAYSPTHPFRRLWSRDHEAHEER